jgi:MoxR-like ATPase
VEREVAIVRLRAPEVTGELARQVAEAVSEIRALGLYKPPGIAETIDWARALTLLGRTTLDPAAAAATLGSVVKYHEDGQRVHDRGIEALVREAVARSA